MKGVKITTEITVAKTDGNTPKKLFVNVPKSSVMGILTIIPESRKKSYSSKSGLCGLISNLSWCTFILSSRASGM